MQADLVKNPRDWAILDRVDIECTFPEARSSECTAPPGYKCAYRRFNGPSHLEKVMEVESVLARSRPLRFITVRS